MLLKGRFEPYKPVLRDDHYIKDREKLEEFEKINAEGLVFVPDEALPPWKKSVISNLKKSQNQYNYRGLRVRAVDRQDEPGFPTHFR
ncbi:hypothetical protein AGDE_00597 [Angomonas deanei]|nr:hypothetical protein AGDE_00597 [Angomonas deanei]|eukprot:EPY43325.1 hypothetical protein AGDE_00597 [Angomonas deanei]